MARRSLEARVWSPRRVPGHPSPIRVLVVDDYEIGADAMASLLNAHGMDATAVYGGKEAIRAGHSWQPDLVLMDISMPYCNGYQAAKSFRGESDLKNIVILAFTALDESEVRQHSEDHEFDGYCQKGQAPSKLIEYIQSLCT